MACGCGCGAPSAATCGSSAFSRPVPSAGTPTFPAVRSATAQPIPLCDTLARSLVAVADSLRDLYTQFGLRPYVVQLVRTKWSGGRRNLGTEILAENPIALVPTPLVSDVSSLTEINTPVGLDEFGEVLLSQLSGAYTEDFLRGRDKEGRQIELDDNFYYEIEFPPACEGQEGQRRRFVIKGAPYYQSDAFQWRVRLERARMDRTRAGDPR